MIIAIEVAILAALIGFCIWFGIRFFQALREIAALKREADAIRQRTEAAIARRVADLKARNL
jgi:hypothetical protein